MRPSRSRFLHGITTCTSSYMQDTDRGWVEIISFSWDLLSRSHRLSLAMWHRGPVSHIALSTYAHKYHISKQIEATSVTFVTRLDQLEIDGDYLRWAHVKVRYIENFIHSTISWWSEWDLIRPHMIISLRDKGVPTLFISTLTLESMVWRHLESFYHPPP